MIDIIKTAAKRVLKTTGFELRRRSGSYVWGLDAFADQKALLESHPVETIFDLGANVGQTASLYQVLFPAANIHCFEPFPAAMDQLKHAHAANPRIHTHQMAVAETGGIRTLFANKFDFTNSLFPFAANVDRYVGPNTLEQRGALDVKTTALDEFCADHRIKRINVLKLDIQGGELAALRGAKALLASQSIDVIYSEVLFAELYQGQSHFDETLQYLKSHEYRLFGIYNLYYPGRVGLAWADMIFVKASLMIGT